MNLTGKIAVITGATPGLGQAAAIDFAARGAKVFIVGRDATRANDTAAAAKGKGGTVEVILGDVSTRAGAAAIAKAVLAKAVLAKTDRIDVLLNNAGGQMKEQTQTADGVETTFALNTLGAFVLERALHGALKAAKGRVVNVVTGFLDNFPVPADPAELTAPKKFKSMGAYGQAKLAGVMMTVEQAQRFEMVLVIGRTAKNVKREDAMQVVAGYTVANDYAIRDYLENYYRPNLRVKNRDTCTVLGPWLVDAVDVPDPHDLALRTLVNGQVTQQGNTSDMVADIPALIEYLSSFMTLGAGDVILTGTPDGVVNVNAGDEVITEIDGIGRLVNTIVGDTLFGR